MVNWDKQPGPWTLGRPKNLNKQAPRHAIYGHRPAKTVFPKISIFPVIYIVIGTPGQRGLVEFLQIGSLPGGCEAGVLIRFISWQGLTSPPHHMLDVTSGQFADNKTRTWDTLSHPGEACGHSSVPGFIGSKYSQIIGQSRPGHDLWVTNIPEASLMHRNKVQIARKIMLLRLILYCSLIHFTRNNIVCSSAQSLASRLKFKIQRRGSLARSRAPSIQHLILFNLYDIYIQIPWHIKSSMRTWE